MLFPGGTALVYMSYVFYVHLCVVFGYFRGQIGIFWCRLDVAAFRVVVRSDMRGALICSPSLLQRTPYAYLFISVFLYSVTVSAEGSAGWVRRCRVIPCVVIMYVCVSSCMCSCCVRPPFLAVVVCEWCVCVMQPI